MSSDPKVVQWKEAFFFQGPPIQVSESVTFTLTDSQDGNVLEELKLELWNVFAMPGGRFSGWLKTGSGAVSLLVRCILEGVSDTERGAATITFTQLVVASPEKGGNATSADKEANRKPNDQPTCPRGSLTVTALEALRFCREDDRGEALMRSSLFVMLLPWGTSNKQCRAQTRRCWSDGNRAKWTKAEHNKMSLDFPGQMFDELEQVLLRAQVVVDGRTDPLCTWSIPLESVLRGPNGASHTRWVDADVGNSQPASLRLKICFKALNPDDPIQTEERVSLTVCVRPRIQSSEEVGSLADQEPALAVVVDELALRRFFSAVKRGDAQELEAMLEDNPVLANAKSSSSPRRTGLHVAVIARKLRCVELLIARGADPEAMDEDSRKPGFYSRDVKILKALGELAPSSTLVTQASRIKAIETVLQGLDPLDGGDDTRPTAAGERSTADYGDGNASGCEDHAGDDALIEVFDAIQGLAQQSSPRSVFELFDMDDDGFVDEDEFEGSMRVVSQHNPEDRSEHGQTFLRTVRKVARDLCSAQSNGRCPFPRFVDYFCLNNSREGDQALSVDDERLLREAIAGLNPPISANAHMLWNAPRAGALLSKIVGSSFRLFENVWWSMLVESHSQVDALVADLERIGASQEARLEAIKGFDEMMTADDFVLRCLVLTERRQPTCPLRFYQLMQERFGMGEGASLTEGAKFLKAILDGEGKPTQEAVDAASEKMVELFVNKARNGKVRRANGMQTTISGIAQELFTAVDKDNDGEMNQAEFGEAMRKVGVFDPVLTKEMFHIVDSNRDGRIQVSEFVQHLQTFVLRKRKALAQVLLNLQQQQEEKAHEKKPDKDNNRGRTRLEAKLALLRSGRGPKASPAVTFSNIYSVDWGCTVDATRPVQGTESSTELNGENVSRTVESLSMERVCSYDALKETLLLDSGRVVLLGRDKVHALWNRAIVAHPGDDELLHSVKVKLEALALLEGASAIKIQRLYQRNVAKAEALRVVKDRRKEKRQQERQAWAGTKIQAICRGRYARSQRAKLELARRREAERIAQKNLAASKLQARSRGYLVRQSAMEKRAVRHQAAATKLQASSRGFLVRSAESRLNRLELSAILEALRATFRLGFRGRLVVDVPRLSNDLIRLDAVFGPFDAKAEPGTTGKTRHEALYGLEATPSSAEGKSADMEPMVSAVVSLVQRYGIANPDKELPVSVFRNSHKQQNFTDVVRKSLESAEDKVVSMALEDIASAVHEIHDLHSADAVLLNLRRALVEEQGKVNDLTGTGRVEFKVFRYLQRNRSQSFAWVQVNSHLTNRVRTRDLQLRTFQGLDAASQEDEILRQVHTLAVVCGELDLYSLCRVVMDGGLTLQDLSGEEATLVGRWGAFKFQIEARLSFSKSRKLVVQNEALPPRPRCKRAEILSVMAVREGESGGASSRNEVEKDPEIFKIDFFDVQLGPSAAVQASAEELSSLPPAVARLPKEFARAAWMPPLDAKVFCERVYQRETLSSSARASAGASDDAFSATFSRVAWRGTLTSSSETVDDVCIDAWRRDPEEGILVRVCLSKNCLGWFSLSQCKNVLRLVVQLDEESDEAFATVCEQLTPFDESARILNRILRHVREQLVPPGVRRSFRKHCPGGDFTTMDRGELTAVLIKRYDCMRVILDAVEGDFTEAKLLLDKFVHLFPEKLTLADFAAVFETPILDLDLWIRTMLHKKEGSFIYLRAKFRSMHPSLLGREKVVATLVGFLEDEEGLTAGILDGFDWTPFQDPDSGEIKYVDFLTAMERHQDPRECQHDGALGEDDQEGHDSDEDGTDGEAKRVKTSNKPVWFGHGPEMALREGSDKDNDDNVGVSPEQSRDELLEELIDDEEDARVLGEEMVRDKAMRHALAELRCVILEYASADGAAEYDLERTFRVFDRDRTGTIDAAELRLALQCMNIEEILPSEAMLLRFIKLVDKNGDDQIDFAEFEQLVGSRRPKQLLKVLRRSHPTKTIRWDVEVLLGDSGLWMSGTATRYRAFDHSILIELKPRKDFCLQEIGFLQLDDYPVFLRRNAWSGKPWGREPLWRSVLATRVADNTKAALEEAFRRGDMPSARSLSSSSSSSSSFLTTASSATSLSSPTTPL